MNGHVSVLVEHWDATGKHLRDVRVDSGMPYLDYQDKLEVLRLVARRMQDGPAGLAGNHISGQDLLHQFDGYLRDRFQLPPDRSIPAAKAMLEQLRERNFILARFGGGVYGFVHRVFLEYLAAYDIWQRFSAREMTEGELLEVFRNHWNDPSWQEVLLLISGMIPGNFAAQVIDFLLASDPLWYMRSDPMPRHLLLAAGCLGEVRRPGSLVIQSRAVVAAAASLLERAGGLEGYRLGFTVIPALEKTALPVFTSLGPDWAGGEQYQRWYLTVGQFLGTRLFYETSAGVAARLFMALLSRHDDQNRHTLHTFTQLAPQTVRRAAFQVLADGWRDDPATAVLLRDRATADTDWQVRQAAVQALADGWRDDPATAELLRDRATADTDEDVRKAAVQALADGWRDDPATAELLRDRATADTNAGVRQAAVQALADGWRDYPATAPWLRDRATADTNEDVRKAAVQALADGWRDDPATAPWLRERAADTDWQVRRAAVQTLAGGWRDDPATPELLRDRATADTDAGVRRAAVQVLAGGWRDDPATAPWLRDRATTDTNANVRQAALQVLAGGWRNDPATAP